MKAGRNELCPCGSGKKSKHCCAGRVAEREKMRGILMVAAPLLLLAAIGVYAALRDGNESGRKGAAIPARSASQAPATPAAQPPGPAPAGKVWDAAHGHWHDVEAPIQVQSSAGNRGIQMDGTNLRVDAKTMEGLLGPGSAGPNAVAPPGKVWSPEHNHWHDAPNAPAVPTPPPNAGAEGVVWSAEHNHWHRPDGTAAAVQPPPPRN